ncbi:MAG: lasso peptide biosynthesis B2 protein [Methylocella sp.]
MPLRRKLSTFLGMSSADRLLVCEAILALALARLIVLTVPFRLLTPWLSRAPETAACDEALLLCVRTAVATAARNVPWNAACLPQAMAAKAMLTRRGCGSSFHLGAGFNAQGKLITHAWLVAGGTIVVGTAGIGSVTPLARFG